MKCFPLGRELLGGGHGIPLPIFPIPATPPQRKSRITPPLIEHMGRKWLNKLVEFRCSICKDRHPPRPKTAPVEAGALWGDAGGTTPLLVRSIFSHDVFFFGDFLNFGFQVVFPWQEGSHCFGTRGGTNGVEG